MKKLTVIFLLVIGLISNLYPQGCLPDGIWFLTQEQIDSFQVNYPGCTKIQGDVFIGDYPVTAWISDLSGLNVLDSIEGDLSFHSTEGLDNLTGLENLTYVGGELLFYNNYDLFSLTGLENLTYIGEGLSFTEHEWLHDLPLNSLTSINGHLIFNANDILFSLAGLKNIDPNSIYSISILGNPNLHVCAVESICQYLAAPGAYINISNNGPGCNTKAEIVQACLTTIPKNTNHTPFTIQPNHSNESITITANNHQQINVVNIYDLAGDLVLKAQEHVVNIRVNMLNPGMYIVEVVFENQSYRQKLIIQ